MVDEVAWVCVINTRHACRSRAEFSIHDADPVVAIKLEATRSRDTVPAPLPKSGNGLVEHHQHRHAFLHRCKLRENGTPLQSIPIVGDLPIAEQIAVSRACRIVAKASEQQA